MKTCAVCGRLLGERDGYNSHQRLGRSWCWGHEMDAVNVALGEDVSMHTWLWHVPTEGPPPAGGNISTGDQKT